MEQILLIPEKDPNKTRDPLNGQNQDSLAVLLGPKDGRVRGSGFLQWVVES